MISRWSCHGPARARICARQSRCAGITAVVCGLRRLLAVVEQWLSAPRLKRRWHCARESGLLAGLLGAGRWLEGAVYWQTPLPVPSREVQHRRVARLLSAAGAAVWAG